MTLEEFVGMPAGTSELRLRRVPRVNCPDCGATGFTVSGFRLHRGSRSCRAHAKGTCSSRDTESVIEEAVRGFADSQGWRK